MNNIKLINDFSKNDPNPFLQTQLPELPKKFLILSVHEYYLNFHIIWMTLF